MTQYDTSKLTFQQKVVVSYASFYLFCGYPQNLTICSYVFIMNTEKSWTAIQQGKLKKKKILGKGSSPDNRHGNVYCPAWY